MVVVESLINGAMADIDLLRTLDAQGDDFNRFRDVDFILRAPSQEQAQLVADFINDYQFGDACALQTDGSYSVQVIINMPITQKIILSVSGFMTCIAALYGLEFDGWGCQIQASSEQN